MEYTKYPSSNKPEPRPGPGPRIANQVTVFAVQEECAWRAWRGVVAYSTRAELYYAPYCAFTARQGLGWEGEGEFNRREEEREACAWRPGAHQRNVTQHNAIRE